MYDKLAEDLERRHKDVFDMVEAKGEAKGLARGRNEMIKAMISVGLNIVSKLSGLSKQDILSII